MVGTPNIKINTNMIDEFETPFSANPNTYIKVDAYGKAAYLTPEEVKADIAAGDEGGSSSNDTNWEPNTQYFVDDIFVYEDCFWQCIEDHTSGETFDKTKWKLLAGFYKTSKYFYDPVNPISSITLDEAIPNKYAVQININNLLLQSNNYTLSDDGYTITFLEPIEPDTNIEAIVFGNMIIPTNVSQVMTKTFTTTVDNTTEFPLEEVVRKKNLITVNIENTVIQNSEWELNDTLDTVVLKNPVPTGTRVQISWFNNLEVQIGATYTPHINKTGRDTTLSWTNDGGLENPADSHIYDGITFTPSQSKVGTETTLSWTNDGNVANPESVVIKDGATFTPDVSKTGYTTTISWTNDVGLDNPDNVTILDGIKYVPTVTKEGLNTTISWSNDQGATNPDTVVIEDGATFTPHTTQGVHEATISFTNDKGLENPDEISIYTNYAQRIVDSFTATAGQTTFVATHEIYDKSVLSVNIGNTELTSAAYTLGTDKKTVTLLGEGLLAGDLVDLKYFYNLNLGTQGVTYTPTLTPIENGYELSWTNDGERENPEPVDITSGKGFSYAGTWSDTATYEMNDYVTYEDNDATYGYIAIAETVAAGTALTDTNSWTEMYKILKTYIAATIKDWGE